MKNDDKIVQFNTGLTYLMGVAEQKYDEQDYIGSLRAINKRNRLYKPNLETYMFLADLYDEMEIFDLAINSWFKCLDLATDEMFPEIYEGLGACYYNYGNEPQAAYYYNKVLQYNDEISMDAKLEIINLFNNGKNDAFRIVYPPEKVDYTSTIENAISQIKNGNFKNAVELLSKVDEKSKQSIIAQNYIAICYLLTDRLKDAERICREILAKAPKNIQATSTLAAILVEDSRGEESKKLVEELYKLKPENPDEIYKIATVCCENKMHKEAYILFCQLEKQVAFDSTLKFFKAMSAFNAGYRDVCLDELSQLIDINPNYEVVKYYFRQVRKYIENNIEGVELSYFYRVPTNERNKRLLQLNVLLKESKKFIKENVNYEEIISLLYWCFDEADGRDFVIQELAVKFAIKNDYKNFIADILLNASVNDIMKIEIIKQIGYTNKSCVFGSVICGIYTKINFRTLQLPAKKRKKFIIAYSNCFAKYDMFDENYGDMLYSSTINLYFKLESEDKLNLVEDEKDLACAIYINSGIENKKYKRRIIKDFNANAENVFAILSV